MDFYTFIYIIYGGIALFVAFCLRLDWKQARSSSEAVVLYNSLPDVVGYLNCQPQARTPTGPRCAKCESNHLGSFVVVKKTFLDLGLRPAKQAFIGRVHFCKRCDTRLYRTTGQEA